MRFSIVTPSFRSGTWLRLCIPSVADQGADVLREHLVQDAGSDDGTLDWLPSDPRVRAVVEKDRGMYDAVNRGFRRAEGEFLAYLNCDEQYLPGALAAVAREFDARPEVDVLLADSLIVHPDGSYLCYRRSVTPTRLHTQLAGTLSFLTSSLFLRRRVISEHGLFFDDRYRDLGDTAWTLRLLASGLRVRTLRVFTSVFTETGENMSLKPNAIRERAELVSSVPAWARHGRSLIEAAYRLRKWRQGAYRCDPHAYAIYTRSSPAERQIFTVAHPTFRWTRVPLAPPAGG
jgi:glycosyltransferase involved in cell wall biosynthesis